MADLGAITLSIALVLSSYSMVGSVLGRRLRIPELVESARYATYLAPLTLVIASLSLVAAFVTRDFQISYVAAHSSRAMDHIYTWVAFYAGNEGSLLYIALALSILSALAVALAPRRFRDTLPYTNAILMAVLTFFLAVMIFLASPFDKLPVVPSDGQGINPLLTHFGMFIHPPMLMAGLVMVAIPFSFAMGSLLAGKTGDEWVDPGRVWGIIAWATLGTGLLLGAWWAYTILGWGGYWAWDPIENVGFMPWLALTAFIHSIMVQKRRGMFRMWNIALVNVAFGLAQFGMFMNRGGPVPSVHSFGQSTLGWIFLLFMGITMAASFALFFYRFKTLKSAQPLESMLSREVAFLVNNLLLLLIAFVTLWGTVFPLISDVFQGETVTVGEPFYNQVNGPLFLALIFLMGIGPLLPWRQASLTGLRRALFTPAVLALFIVALLAIVGVRKPFPLASFGLCSLVAASILQEWVRGTRARHGKGENYGLAFGRLIMANRPRYGGYVVHLAIVLLALGVAGSAFYGQQRDVVLAPGERAEIGDYGVEYLGARVEEKADRTEFIADLRLYKNGSFLDDTSAWRAFYTEARMSSTRAAIRSTPVEDLYIINSEFLDGGQGVFRIMVNPLVMWMWIAGPVLILGSVIALWPTRREELAYVRSLREARAAPVAAPLVRQAHHERG